MQGRPKGGKNKYYSKEEKLKKLYEDDNIDLTTYRELTMAVVIQYNEMQKNAPIQSTRDKSTFTQKEELDLTPVKPYSPEKKQKVENKQSVFESNDTEQQRRRKQEEKEKLEQQRRDLRRKQFAQRTKEMGIDRDTIINFDELERQQEMIDRINHEQEIIEDHGMHM